MNVRSPNVRQGEEREYGVVEKKDKIRQRSRLPLLVSGCSLQCPEH